MSWVSIDETKCSGCGICVMSCPRCFFQENGTFVADATEGTCIQCGHCVSLCPTGAVVHEKLAPKDFGEIDTQTHLEPENFVRFLKERRSHRQFTDRPVPQEELEKLVDVCRWAPTGSNTQNVEIVLYRDRDKIGSLSDLVVDYFVWIAERAGRKVVRLGAEGKQDTDDYRLAQRTVDMAANMSAARDAARDPIFHKAPVLMVFHANASPLGSPKDNCVLAAHTAALTARTLGMESCYIGLLEIAAQYFQPVASALALPKENKVFESMILGYPSRRFLRTVPRKPVGVRWE